MPRFVVRKSAADREPSRVEAGDPGRFAVGGGPARLRALAAQGLGEQFAVQHALARMERTTTDTAPVERHVVTIEDVTRGLGLTHESEVQIQNMIRDTPVEFTPKTQTQRVFLAKGKLVDVLRALAVPGDARLEIARRAGAWWRKAFETELIRKRGPEQIRWKSESSERLVATPPSARRPLRLEW